MSFKSLLLAADLADIPLDKLEFPMYLSPKIDGFRGAVYDGKLRTRSNKPLANKYVSDILSDDRFTGFDGELTCLSPNHPLVFRETSAKLRKIAGEPDFTMWLFDDFSYEGDYESRLINLSRRVLTIDELYSPGTFKVINQHIVQKVDDILYWENKYIEDGFEGVMLRDMRGRYKWGRSTAKEGIIFKMKRKLVEEAVIVGFVELMHNENEAFTNELGKTARQSLKENLVSSGMLGSYICRSPKYKDEFRVSCGSMTHEERESAWQDRSYRPGDIISFEHFGYGSYDRPRQGIFRGYRDPSDILPEFFDACENNEIYVRR